MLKSLCYHARFATVNRLREPTMRRLLSLLGISAVVALAGCGTRGPLVLPPRPGATPAPTSPSTPLPSHVSTDDDYNP